MHEALHGEMTRHYQTWLWIFNNLATGSSYFLIAYYITIGWRIRWRFASMFAMFIGACGGHHIVHSIPSIFHIPHAVVASLQVVADCTMTTVSVLTAIMVHCDWVAQIKEQVVPPDLFDEIRPIINRDSHDGMV
jgi:hypothetical protein